LGFEGGGSFGKTYGRGAAKLIVSLQGDLILLYFNGQTRRDLPGFLFVEWPSNLTVGWSLILRFGGGWVSIFDG
jgi:hypothetical protein